MTFIDKDSPYLPSHKAPQKTHAAQYSYPSHQLRLSLLNTVFNFLAMSPDVILRTEGQSCHTKISQANEPVGKLTCACFAGSQDQS